ncbi:MAG: DUF4290 domain-containing protein [Bacteroidales bacterium]|nr:DUF4290 domain-containing protein [Bacteroidales bacterium]
MEYNTKRGDMMYREYGRTIKKLIDKVCDLTEDDKRDEAAKSLVYVMGQVGGMSVKDEVQYRKLWDHLMIMSEFRLAKSWPFGEEELEQLRKRADEESSKPKTRLQYKNVKIENRQYGEYLEKMMKKLNEVPDGEEYDALSALMAQQAKRDYLVWNGELAEDNIVIDQMTRMSGDARVGERLRDKAIDVPLNTLPTDITPTKKKKKKK